MGGGEGVGILERKGVFPVGGGGGGGRENEMGGATTRVRPVDMHMMCNIENSDG